MTESVSLSRGSTPKSFKQLNEVSFSHYKSISNPAHFTDYKQDLDEIKMESQAVQAVNMETEPSEVLTP